MELTFKGRPYNVARGFLRAARSAVRERNKAGAPQADRKSNSSARLGSTLSEQEQLYDSFLEKQAAADKVQQRFSFLSQMMKKSHDTIMAIIRNL